jgi:DNA-binding transcriptional ArsR family regulator
MSECFSNIFAALGSPVRLAMTEALLRNGPVAMTELGKPFGFSLTGTRKHVQVLQDAGLVTCSKIGRENFCAVNPAALQAASRWLGQQEKFWTASFDRLEKLLQRKPS